MTKRFVVFYGSQSDDDHGYSVIVQAPDHRQAESVVLECSPWADYAQGWSVETLRQILDRAGRESDRVLTRDLQKIAIENHTGAGGEIGEYDREATINALRCISGAAVEASS